MIQFLRKWIALEVAKKLILRLFYIDLIFIGIHIGLGLINYLGYIDDLGQYNFLKITRDQSFSELFQYLKYIAFIGITILLMRKERSYLYISWLLLFLFFLLDDSLSLHEMGGEFLAEQYNFEPKFGLRAVDFGELSFITAIGVVLLFSLGISYFKGSSIFRKRTRTLMFLLGFLVIFGVGFDMLHEILGENLKVRFLIGLIEDGGEMLIVTLMVGYAYQLIKSVETYRLI